MRGLAAVLLVACGAATPSPNPTPSQTPSANPTPSQTPNLTPITMKAPKASEMVADLQAIGLDAKNLPPLSKLEPDKLRKVMKLFTRSLGVPCRRCHTEPMDAPTPTKRIAEQMWTHFARGLTTSESAPIFCDSCHQGSDKLLDRHDKKALGKWMDENYVDKMKRKDGKEHECATCHGEELEYQFMKIWGAGKPFP